MATPHPLTILPTSSLLSALDQVTKKPAVHPLRQRVNAYLKKRDGPSQLSDLTNKAGVFFSRMVTGQNVVAFQHLPPTYQELRTLRFTFNDLFDDNTCAFSLEELYDAGVITSWEQVQAFNPTINDLLGVGVTESRFDRFNPQVIRTLFGDAAITPLHQQLFVDPGLFWTKYLGQIHPDTLDALGLDLNTVLATPENVAYIAGAPARLMLSAGPPDRWSNIGLKRAHLKTLDLGASLQEICKNVDWDIAETQSVFFPLIK